MSVERQALLGALPRIFRTGPQPVAALTCSWAGAGALTIAVTEAALELAVDDEPLATIARAGTLAELALALTALPDVGVAIAAGAELLRAAVLLEAPALSVGGGGLTLFRWSNPTWRFLEAVRPLLEDAAADVDVAVAQLNLLEAGGDFAELWGRLTGTVRDVDELDDAYTARQRHELLRPRENNQGLAALLEEDTGVVVEEIADLRRDVFVCSGSRLRGRPLAGRRFNACTAEVRVRGFPGGMVAHLAELHAAGGVTVFVTGTLELDGLGSDLDIGSGALQVGEPPPMQIAVTPIGIGQIGA